MITYVNTVFVSNSSTGTVATSMPTASTANTANAKAGLFIIMAVDADSNSNVVASAAGMANVDAIKIGMITNKNVTMIDPSTKTLKYTPIIKWSNIIKKADLKSYVKSTYTDDTEDTISINFRSLDSNVLGAFAVGGKRIIVRLTFKDLPTRFRKWTESYEYVTKAGDTVNSVAIAIADMINKQWKRARVVASLGIAAAGTNAGDPDVITAATEQTKSNANTVILTAMQYDDDNSVDTINWANKVRFNANIYYTDPAADGWESLNKHYPTGVEIEKTPGKTYSASAKLVRDREAQAMGYEGILNRGEGTWPVIKPAMETKLDGKYDAITLEFENMYRAADDIFRKTKQTVEIYGETGGLKNIASYLDTFVNDAAVVPTVKAGAVKTTTD